MKRRLRKQKPKSWELKMKIADKISVWKCEGKEGNLFWSRKSYRDPIRNILIEIHIEKYSRDISSIKELKIRYGKNGEKFDYQHLSVSEMKTILAKEK